MGRGRNINKNESIEGGWGAGCSPPAYTSRRHRLSRHLIKMGGVSEANSNNINKLNLLQMSLYENLAINFG